MQAYLRLRATALAVLALATLAPLSARAGCPPQRPPRSHATSRLCARAPVTIHVQPAPAPAPRAAPARDFWGPGAAPRPRAPRPGGFVGTTRAATRRSYDAMGEAFDPLVDPVLESTTEAAGTLAGTALGIALYPPMKVLQHVFRGR